MSLPLPASTRDPVGWSGVIAFAFLALVLVRLGIPTRHYFDEVHYVPAALILSELSHITNQEHPLVGKELIALGIGLFGDNPKGWRVFSALAGAIALFSFMRALWFASASRFATLAGGVLLATGFMIFVHSRIAMLDIFMVSFLMAALWMCAAAIREPAEARWRLAIAGVVLGLAIGTKWNAAPVAMMPGIGFFLARLISVGPRGLFTAKGAPVPTITLVEAAFWLGLVPLATYAATFLPVFFFDKNPLTLGTFIQYQQHMVELQQSTVKPHTYMSRWYYWVIDWRAIWYLYDDVDGAQRGVVLLGNPLTMLLGLPALVWCTFAGIARRNWAALGAASLYAVSLGMWIVAPKPVQFFYHYMLPSCFLIAALALALDDLWQRGGARRLAAAAVLVGSCALFAWFYPIISAAPLGGPKAFEYWMWLKSWR
jgi:dolichyl-phosphate-mannose--protein O-mannosyl transferase